jgi:hypothetical protein
MHRTRLFSDARHGDVSELLFGSELVESGFSCDLRKELELSSELFVGWGANLDSVDDTRVHLGGVGYL